MEGMTLVREAEKALRPIYEEIEEISYQNQKKVLDAFRSHHVHESHFNLSSGYGLNDLGRDALEDIYSSIFGTEDSIVRSQIVSGTHAVSLPLFALLDSGDELVSLLGAPYDTLYTVIGKTLDLPGSLLKKGIQYKEVPLTEDLHFNYEAAKNIVTPKTKMVLLQRSRGYSLRPGCTLPEIKKIIAWVRSVSPDIIVMVDNCYGEFTCTEEPTQAGADIMAGSLIKNPGGGIAVSGGYLTGRRDLIELISYYLTAPGLGKELGASQMTPRLNYQGLFLAPHVVGQAMKGSCLLSYIMEENFKQQVSPHWNDLRGDIVQTVQMKSAEQVRDFCQIVQNFSPVDSDITLEYGEMSGYEDKVVMAAGTFIQGSSIELSCDAPLREPYTIYWQGGLTYEHVRFVISELAGKFLSVK